jgi:micrococcal nuclease
VSRRRRAATRGLPSWRRILRGRKGGGLLVAIVLCLLALARESQRGPSQAPGAPSGPGPSAPAAEASCRVASVEDGDTVTLEDGQRVRYAGIDAPERGEPLHGEALDYNERRVQGRLVRLTRPGREDADGYGRLLRVVVLDDSGDAAGGINAELVREGLASVYIHGPESLNPTTLAALLRAQDAALAARKGIWPARLAAAGRRAAELVSTRFRVHRRSCSEIAGRNLPPVRSIEEELRRGKSPCRTCKPFQ